MGAGVPDRDFVGLPRFGRAYSHCLGRNVRDNATARRPGILNQCHRVQIDNSGGQFAVLFRGRRLLIVRWLPLRRVIESPVFHFTLASLHDGTPGVVPRFDVLGRIGLRKVDIAFWHPQIGTNAVKQQFPVGPRKT